MPEPRRGPHHACCAVRAAAAAEVDWAPAAVAIRTVTLAITTKESLGVRDVTFMVLDMTGWPALRSDGQAQRRPAWMPQSESTLSFRWHAAALSEAAPLERCSL